jgi:ketosteroid isomerase-like protein
MNIFGELFRGHKPKRTLKDSTVRVFGDTAVLMGLLEMEIPQEPGQIRMTTVFRKSVKSWQVMPYTCPRNETQAGSMTRGAEALRKRYASS